MRYFLLDDCRGNPTKLISGSPTETVFGWNIERSSFSLAAKVMRDIHTWLQPGDLTKNSTPSRFNGLPV
jgi:hypothetical protein